MIFTVSNGVQPELRRVLDLCAEQYAQRTLTAQELKALSAVQDEEVDYGTVRHGFLIRRADSNAEEEALRRVLDLCAEQYA